MHNSNIISNQNQSPPSQTPRARSSLQIQRFTNICWRGSCRQTEGVLARVSVRRWLVTFPLLRFAKAFASLYARDVQKPILILVLLVYAAHERGGRWEDLVDEDEDGLLWRKLDALADDIDELANREVGRHQVFLLVYGCDV